MIRIFIADASRVYKRPTLYVQDNTSNILAAYEVFELERNKITQVAFKDFISAIEAIEGKDEISYDEAAMELMARIR